MDYTISTHFGKQYAREHNRRNPAITDYEDHIQKDGYHETWIDERVEDAYRRLFQESIDEYNEKCRKKGRSKRCIDNYFKQICSDEKMSPVYELIVSIGDRDHHPDLETSRQIFQEFIDSWKERNGSLELIGLYFHGDEGGATYHIHCDIVPIKRNCTRGPKVQTSLSKALEQIGFKSKSYFQTGVVAWERRENDLLDRICRDHGLNIIHPQRDAKEKARASGKPAEQIMHESTAEYKLKKKLKKEIKALQEQKTKIIRETNDLITKHNQILDDIEELQDEEVDLAYDIIEDLENDTQTDRAIRVR